jgi:hypothetical protein
LRIVNPSPYMAYVQVYIEAWSTTYLNIVMCTDLPLRF